MKTFIYISFAWLSALTSFTNFNAVRSELAVELNIPANDSLSSVIISATGDLMCHSVQFNYARTSDSSYDFSSVFREIKDYLSAADLAIGNLETVLAGEDKKYSGFPFFNSPDEFLTAISDAGFDLLITANNHALDKGIYGLRRTLNKIREAELNSTGTFLSEADRDSVRIFRINDISFAVLAYSYGTNGLAIPDNQKFCINLIDEDLIQRDIKSARESGAEIVIVHFHFGNEYKRFPDKYQNDVVDYTINSGADIIIADHPHVIQPVKFFKPQNPDLDRGLIAFSLGNFISNQRWRYSDAGVILHLRLTKNIYSGKLSLSEVSYTPTWVFKGNTGIKNEYVIIPLNEDQDYNRYSYLSLNNIFKMNQAFEDTKEILTHYTNELITYKLPDSSFRSDYKHIQIIPKSNFP